MATNAITLDGSTQYGKALNYAALDALGDYTYETWAWYDPAAAAYSTILQVGSGASVFGGISSENGYFGLNFQTNYGGANNADGYSATSFGDSAWHHIAFEHDSGTKKTYIYVDGVEPGYNLQQVGAGTLQSSSGFHIFVGIRSSLTGGWKGKIGGFVRLWNVRRSVADLTRTMNQNLTAASYANLIANFKFLEGSGTTIANQVSGGNALVLTGAPSWTTGPTIVGDSPLEVALRRNY